MLLHLLLDRPSISPAPQYLQCFSYQVARCWCQEVCKTPAQALRGEKAEATGEVTYLDVANLRPLLFSYLGFGVVPVPHSDQEVGGEFQRPTQWEGVCKARWGWQQREPGPVSGGLRGAWEAGEAHLWSPWHSSGPGCLPCVSLCAPVIGAVCTGTRG